MRVVEQNQKNPYECSSSHAKVVACAIGVSCYSLVCSFSALLASFLALLLPQPLELQFPFFVIERVRVVEIENGKARGGERIACNGSKRCKR
jgi:hypothetical protein